MAACFHTISAEQVSLGQYSSESLLTFDDVATHHGWADVPSAYAGLEFSGFHIFKPTDSAFDGLVSKYDLNCAVSRPNALYGSRYLSRDLANKSSESRSIQVPKLWLNQSSTSHERSSTFALLRMDIKVLDMPFAYTKLTVRGTKKTDDVLSWDVDFPAEFHDMLEVDMAKFSSQTWANLTSVEIWADFHNDDEVLDWEFCLDNLVVGFED